MKRRQTTSPEGLVLHEITGPITITADRPAAGDPATRGYPWDFLVTCKCGWATTIRSWGGQYSWWEMQDHVSRCTTAATEWRPPQGG
jgi:hypothetical protein